MILTVFLPGAIAAGISEKDFRRMTLSAVKLHIEQYLKNKQEERKRIEYGAWITGYYNMYAIGASMSKKIKYPKNPMEEERAVDENMKVSEEEAEHYRTQFVKRLQRMESRFNKEKEKQEKMLGR